MPPSQPGANHEKLGVDLPGDEPALRAAMQRNPSDPNAPLELGNWLYAHNRRPEAIESWEHAVKLDRSRPEPWRKLGIAYFNVQHDANAAKGAYHRAFQHASQNPDILLERDQLWKLTGEPPAKRLVELDKYPALVEQREALIVEQAAILRQSGDLDAASALILSRPLQTPAGLTQRLRLQISLGRRALWRSEPEAARNFFQAALQNAPLADPELQYWLAQTAEKLGDPEEAARHHRQAAAQQPKETFQPSDYYAIESLRSLNRAAEAQIAAQRMLAWARDLAAKPQDAAPISPPAPPKPFEPDPGVWRQERAMLLEALARAILREKKLARRLLEDILLRQPNDDLAADFLIAVDWQT